MPQSPERGLSRVRNDEEMVRVLEGQIARRRRHSGGNTMIRKPQYGMNNLPIVDDGDFVLLTVVVPQRQCLAMAS